MNSELEREAFEANFPVPNTIHFRDGHYLPIDLYDEDDAHTAHRYTALLAGWKAGRAALSTEAQPEVVGAVNALRRLIARWRTFKDHADSLNRRAEVETVLWNVAAGKRPMLTQDECRKLALKLGVPSAYRNNHGD